MITCKFENKGEASLRHVVVDAIIIRDQQILLVKRSPDSSVEPDKYALPGGYLERDESADQGILREALEETGFHTDIISLFHIVHQPRMKGDDRQNVGFVYLLMPKQQIQDPDHEITSIHWFNLNQLPSPEQVAFDHHDFIKLYQSHLKSPQQLPYINFQPIKH